MQHEPAAALLASAAPILEIRGLTKRFADLARPAVEGLDLAVRPGEFLALLGPSGCGKTTTLRLIGGFEAPDAGRVLLKARDITHLPPERRRIGFVFQDYALFPHLSVIDNVRFGLRALARRDALARAQEMLALVGLEALALRRPHELSGGQQQRVALARTLAVAPPVVLLDEPFSNLDASLRAETRAEVRALLRRTSSTAIVVTHDQEEALSLADRVAVMEGGRLRQLGTPDAIYRRPASPFVARFIGRANLVPAQALGAVADTPFGRLELAQAATGAVAVSIRPEQIRLALDPDGAGRVSAREFRGHDQFYRVRAGAIELNVITSDAVIFEEGARVRLDIDEGVVALDGALGGAADGAAGSGDGRGDGSGDGEGGDAP